MYCTFDPTFTLSYRLKIVCITFKIDMNIEKIRYFIVTNNRNVIHFQKMPSILPKLTVDLKANVDPND